MGNYPRLGQPGTHFVIDIGAII